MRNTKTLPATRRALASATFVCVVAWGALAACSRAPDAADASAIEDTGVIVALAPAGTSTVETDPAKRFPSGCRVVRMDEAATVSITEGLDSAGAPSVRWDGERVLFTARERASDAFAVWECGPRGDDRRLAARAAGDCGGAAHLPDGRIVYSAATNDAPPHASVTSSALFVAPGDGTAGTRITWGGADVDPSVLSDGRIVFSTWRPLETGDGGRFVLCTVHPDGSGVAAFHVERAASNLRARQAASLDVKFLRWGPEGASTAAASWDAPSRTVEAGAPPAVTNPPGEAVVDAIPLRRRVRPQGHLSSVRNDRSWGVLVGVDARFGGAGKTLRLSSRDAVLGSIALAADGSFSARVPADRPLRISVVDDDGRELGSEHGSFWLRPGETRVCVGCHDDPETGPPNRRPLALAGEPDDPMGLDVVVR